MLLVTVYYSLVSAVTLNWRLKRLLQANRRNNYRTNMGEGSRLDEVHARFELVLYGHVFLQSRVEFLQADGGMLLARTLKILGRRTLVGLELRRARCAGTTGARGFQGDAKVRIVRFSHHGELSTSST